MISQSYIPVSGPYQAQARKLYDELRTNIIRNVYKVCSIIHSCVYLNMNAVHFVRSTPGQAMYGSNMTRQRVRESGVIHSLVGHLWLPLVRIYPHKLTFISHWCIFTVMAEKYWGTKSVLSYFDTVYQTHLSSREDSRLQSRFKKLHNQLEPLNIDELIAGVLSQSVNTGCL